MVKFEKNWRDPDAPTAWAKIGPRGRFVECRVVGEYFDGPLLVAPLGGAGVKKVDEAFEFDEKEAAAARRKAAKRAEAEETAAAPEEVRTDVKEEEESPRSAEGEEEPDA